MSIEPMYRAHNRTEYSGMKPLAEKAELIMSQQEALCFLAPPDGGGGDSSLPWMEDAGDDH